MLYPQLVTLWIIALALFGKPSTPTYKYCPIIGEQFVNLNTGEVTKVPRSKDTITSLNLPKYLNNSISPDGSRLVGVDLTIGERYAITLKFPIKLTVYPLKHHQKQITHDPEDKIEVSWSPDGHYIAYRYSTEDKQEWLGLADANGNTLKEVRINIAPVSRMLLDSWSADSQYIAFQMITYTDLSTYTIVTPRIFSVPELADAMPSDIGMVKSSMCDVMDQNQPFLHCIKWRTTGHEAVLVAQKGNAIQLHLIEPNAKIKHTVNLLTLQKTGDGAAIFTKWSPDGKKLAVSIGAYSNNEIYNARYKLNIYQPDKTEFNYVDENALGGLYTAEYDPHIQWAWGVDSNQLFYVRYSKQREGLFEIASYDLATKAINLVGKLSNKDTSIDIIALRGALLLGLVSQINEENKGIRLVQLDGSQKLTPILTTNMYYEASPDGETFVALFIPPHNYTRLYRWDGTVIVVISVPTSDGLDWWECDSVF